MIQLLAFKTGLLLGLSLIISIGVQNLFVIRQGLRNQRPYLSALSCFACDMSLILLGVTGVSILLIALPLLKTFMLIAGILFLATYGAIAIRRSFDRETLQQELSALQSKQQTIISTKKVILLALTFSLLNPQAILDTVVIIGGNANHYVDHYRTLFICGTLAASFIWFFGLAASTQYFKKYLMSIRTWVALELLSGGLMLFFAVKFFLQIMYPTK